MPVKKFSKPASCASVSWAGASITSCGVPVGEHAAALEDDDPFAEREDFAVRMRHVQDGNVVRRVPGAQVLDDPRLRGVIEAGQRLVEQQHLRIGDERTRQRGALALAAGNRARLSGEQMSDPKRSAIDGDPFVTLGGRQMRQPVRHVLLPPTGAERAPGAERRSRSAGAAAATLMRCGGIEERRRSPIAICPASGVSSPARQRSSVDLARTRRAEDDRDPRRGVERHIERELIGESACESRRSVERSRQRGNRPGLPQERVDGRQHREREHQQQQRRPVGGGVLKALHLVVNGNRDRARDAGQVAADHQHDAELAKRVREAQGRRRSTMPSIDSGSTIRKNVRQRDAPSVADASSRLAIDLRERGRDRLHRERAGCRESRRGPALRT